MSSRSGKEEASSACAVPLYRPEPKVQVGATEVHQAFRCVADLHNSTCFGGSPFKEL